MKKTLLFFLLSILFGVAWILTFILSFAEMSDSLFSTLLLIRILSLLGSSVAFLISFILFIKNRHFGESHLRKIQVTSIITASLYIILAFIYERTEIDYPLLWFLNWITIFFVGAISIATFIISIVLIATGENKKINNLFIVNLLVVIYPIYIEALFIFLLGIGFGPPS